MTRSARAARPQPRPTLTSVPTPAPSDEDAELEARIKAGEYRRLDELGPVVVDAAALERLRARVRSAKRRGRKAKP